MLARVVCHHGRALRNRLIREADWPYQKRPQVTTFLLGVSICNRHHVSWTGKAVTVGLKPRAQEVAA